jgi:hypothetical protein
MLALSHALDGEGPEGELAYAPALPAIFLAARYLANGDTASLLPWIKAIGLLCLFLEAAGLSALAGALGGRTAARWTFALAAWNPNSWNQLLWGGYAQMLAVGLGASGLALLWRAETRSIWLAGVLFGAVVLTHPYSAFFFAAAAAALIIRRRSFRALAAAPIALVVSLPSIPAYLRFLEGLSIGRSLEACTVSLAEAFQNVLFHPAVNLIMIALLALAIARRAHTAAALGPLFAACGILFVVTPPLHVARAGLLVWHVAVLFMGLTFSRVRPSKVLLALVFATPIVAYADLGTLVRDYAPLTARDLLAMKALGGAAEGRALIVSPTPNIDGWWYEGLTAKPALIGDDLRWSLMRDQQERSVDARTITHATRVRDRGTVRLLTLELPEKTPVTSLWVRNAEFYPLIEWSGSDDDATVLTPAPDVRFRNAVREGDFLFVRAEYLYDEYRWKGFSEDVVVKVEAVPGWSASFSTAGVRIDAPKVALAFELRGVTEPRERETAVDELLARWNVSHVWVRDMPEALRRFDLDPRFERMWESGPVVVFRVHRQPSPTVVEAWLIPHGRTCGFPAARDTVGSR